MKFKNIFVNTVLFTSLFYLTLSIPIFITAFSQKWYDNNYDENWSRDVVTKDKYSDSTNNLIEYFLYRKSLDDRWSNEEKIHYRQVRSIFLKVFLLMILSLVLIIILGKDKLNLIKNYTISNVVLLLIISILIMINFGYFWDYIFHPLLFDDLYWVMNSSQISYYIFPWSFFIKTIQFIIFAAVIENILIYIYLILREKKINFE